MNSLDILHTVNVVSVATSNLRFCYAVPELNEAYQVALNHLESIQPSVSRELYTLLDNALYGAHCDQLCKIRGYEV